MHRRIKRGITIGLIFAVFLIMITACSGNRQSESSDSAKVTEKLETENKAVNEEKLTNEIVVEETVKETNEEVNENTEDSSDNEKSSGAEETKAAKETKDVSDATGANVDLKTVHKRGEETADAGEVSKLEEIKPDRADEQAVFDDGSLIIKLTKLDITNNDSDYELKFSVENKTDQNLKIIAENSLVNDYYMNFGSSDSVSANDQTEIKMIIYKSDLEKAGIEALKTLEFNLLIFDADTYEDYACSETVIIPVSDNNQ